MAAKPPHVLVAQIGARRHYAIPTVLEQAGMLAALYTDLCASWPPVQCLNRIIPRRFQPRLLRRLAGRRADHIPHEKIVCFPGFGLSRLLMRREISDPGRRRAMYVRANQRFGACCHRHGLGEATATYAYNGAALELFEEARANGLQTLLDQTSAPVAFEEALMADERKAWPNWEKTEAIDSGWQPMSAREEAEWALADLIFCGSEFVRDRLAERGVSTSRLRVNPYGIDPRFTAGKPAPRGKGPLRVLYAGGVRLQKGIPYLLEAARLLKDEPVEIQLVGPVLVEEPARRALSEYCELVGPVDRDRMTEAYQQADVFVFPSLCEGSANVCFEALAMGLPVITTAHAGSVVRDGRDGFIVPIRSGEVLAEKIRLLARDEELRLSLAQSAQAHARDYTWEAYGERLVTQIQQVVA